MENKITGDSRADKPGSRPYPALRAKCSEIISAGSFGVVSEYDLMAVVVRRSFGSAFFCACDTLYQKRIRVVQDTIGSHFRQFKKALVVASGPNKGAIPKFEPFVANPHDAQKYALKVCGSYGEGVLLECGLGMPGVPGLEVCRDVHADVAWHYVLQWASDPAMQLNWLAGRLSVAAQFAPVSPETMFVEYLGSIGVAEAEPRGRQYAILSEHFRQLWTAALLEKHDA